MADDDNEVDTVAPHSDGSTRGLLRVWAPVLLVPVILMLAIRFLVFQPYEIDSGSMLPTLEPGDRVVVNRLSYQVGDFERGQVVVFKRPASLDGTNDMIKRVVGLPGETVRFENNAVYIDGLRMVEPYLVDDETTSARAGIAGCEQQNLTARSCVVPDGHVFVIGDNRALSVDSRNFGPIPVDTIIGRASVRLWPPWDISQL